MTSALDVVRTAETAPVRVLHIEHDPLTAALVEAVLDDEGVEVRSVGSGHAALSALEQETFDLVLIDRELPGDGMAELVRQIAARAPDVPLLFTAGRPGEWFEDARTVARPFEQRALVREIRRTVAAAAKRRLEPLQEA